MEISLENLYVDIGALRVIIVHSKYFPNSDWLKAHA